MDSAPASTASAQEQLSSFVSLAADDEISQLILEELSYSRRAFTGVAAEIANSPSSKSTGLNSISEECDEDEQ